MKYMFISLFIDVSAPRLTHAHPTAQTSPYPLPLPVTSQMKINENQ